MACASSVLCLTLVLAFDLHACCYIPNPCEPPPRRRRRRNCHEQRGMLYFDASCRYVPAVLPKLTLHEEPMPKPLADYLVLLSDMYVSSLPTCLHRHWHWHHHHHQPMCTPLRPCVAQVRCCCASSKQLAAAAAVTVLAAGVTSQKSCYCAASEVFAAALCSQNATRACFVVSTGTMAATTVSSNTETGARTMS